MWMICYLVVVGESLTRFWLKTQMNSTILIVESEPLLRKALSLAFTQGGFSAIGVAHYQEALASLDELRPDIVIMDTALADKDGFEACSELRSRFKVPVVLLGEKPTITTWQRVMEVGADCYEVRNCAYPVLVARVRAILRRYQERVA